MQLFLSLERKFPTHYITKPSLTPDRRQSKTVPNNRRTRIKIARNNVCDCHLNLSPVGRQMTIANSVSNDSYLRSSIVLTFSIAAYPDATTAKASKTLGFLRCNLSECTKHVKSATYTSLYKNMTQRHGTFQQLKTQQNWRKFNDRQHTLLTVTAMIGHQDASQRWSVISDGSHYNIEEGQRDQQHSTKSSEV